MKHVLIIGAGPAGLTAAYQILSLSKDYKVTVLEESDMVGGISRTVNYKGNRMDMGGHRFFSKVPEVVEWWEKMLPTQGSVPYDDKVLKRVSHVKDGGPDPDEEDRVMLRRNRISRIFYNDRFFDYPISLSMATLKNMGFLTTMSVGFSYMKSAVFKRPENSLEDFYINRFGEKLYRMFFENYTENLWGRHPSQISPEWGAQRVKELSVRAILKDMIEKKINKKDRKVETSLIEEFSYPKLGPGQLWELTAEEVKKLGGSIIMNASVKSIEKRPEGDFAIGYEQNGQVQKTEADVIFSSMPIKDLIIGMKDTPDEIRAIAEGLPYRDYMTVGVLVHDLKLENETNVRTLGDIVPDNWIYVHDRNVKMGRMQIFNNWSPYMVNDPKHNVWIGLEYFCNEGDEMWSMSDDEFAHMGIREMVTMGLIDSEDNAIDYHVERVKKAYPAYFDTYDRIDEVRKYIDAIPNLYCIGRNGQHRYNNIDHSMCTAFEAVNNLLNGVSDNSNVWNVNTEQEYHEK